MSGKYGIQARGPQGVLVANIGQEQAEAILQLTSMGLDCLPEFELMVKGYGEDYDNFTEVDESDLENVAEGCYTEHALWRRGVN